MSQAKHRGESPRRQPSHTPDACPACGHVAPPLAFHLPQPYPEADRPARACARCGVVRLALD